MTVFARMHNFEWVLRQSCETSRSNETEPHRLGLYTKKKNQRILNVIKTWVLSSVICCSVFFFLFLRWRFFVVGVSHFSINIHVVSLTNRQVFGVSIVISSDYGWARQTGGQIKRAVLSRWTRSDVWMFVHVDTKDSGLQIIHRIYPLQSQPGITPISPWLYYFFF